MERRLRGAEPVEAPEPLLAHLDQLRPVEVGKMAGDASLRQPQDRDHVADAELPTLQEMQDPEPGAIREGPEHPLDPGRRSLSQYMHASDYS